MGRLRSWIIKEQIDRKCEERSINPNIVEELSKNMSNAFYLAAIKELKRRDFEQEDEMLFAIRFTIPRNEFDFNYFLTKQHQKLGKELDPKDIYPYIQTAIEDIIHKDDDLHIMGSEFISFKISEDFSECEISLYINK